MNSSANWVLQVDPVVYKFFKRIPRRDAERLLKAVEELPRDPFLGDIEKMKGEKNVWRKRIGAYRIRYELIKEEKVIYVFRAERRTSKTY
jgi:mRNA-degrading endonuclease RelE of RelBE toxin-antitoxin system